MLIGIYGVNKMCYGKGEAYTQKRKQNDRERAVLHIHTSHEGER